MVCVIALSFSLQTQVEKYGAYLGIASFLGLALLSILYFSQARELRRLRDWAGRAPERDRELEARVSAQAATRVGPREAVAGAAAAQQTQLTRPVPAGNGRPAAVPVVAAMGPRPAVAAERVAAAVGLAAEPVQAPAVAEPQPQLEPVAGSQPEPVAEREAEPATVAAAAAIPAVAAAAAAAPPAEADTTAQPAEADATAQPAAQTTAAPEAEAPAAAAIPRATPLPPREPVAERPAQALRAPAPSATVPPRRDRQAPAPQRREPDTGGRRRGVLIAVLAAIVVLAAGTAAVTMLTGDDGGSTEPNSTTTSAPADTAGAPGTPDAAPAAGETTVVILNGTTTDGLARKAKDTLERAGYSSDRLPTDTSSNQTVRESSVYYATGRRRQGLDVARTLKIDAVHPLDPDTQALAENSFTTPVKADAVVILGADRTP